MSHFVYKYVLNNEIIYIGKNDTNLYDRLNAHGHAGDNISESGQEEISKSDVFFIELVNATMSDCVESELIRRYKPKYNKAKTSEWSGIPFAEPEWNPVPKKTISKRQNGEFAYWLPPYTNSKKTCLKNRFIDLWRKYSSCKLLYDAILEEYGHINISGKLEIRGYIDNRILRIPSKSVLSEEINVSDGCIYQVLEVKDNFLNSLCEEIGPTRNEMNKVITFLWEKYPEAFDAHRYHRSDFFRYYSEYEQMIQGKSWENCLMRVKLIKNGK